MVVLFLVLLPMLLFSLWVFVNYLPRTKKRSAVQRYNRLLALLALLSPGGVALYYWYATRQGAETVSWPALAVIASVFLMALILLLGSVLRMFLFDEEDED